MINWWNVNIGRCLFIDEDNEAKEESLKLSLELLEEREPDCIRLVITFPDDTCMYIDRNGLRDLIEQLQCAQKIIIDSEADISNEIIKRRLEKIKEGGK